MTWEVEIHDLATGERHALRRLASGHMVREMPGGYMYPAPFNPDARFGAGGGLLWVGESASGEVFSYSTEGLLVGRLSLPEGARVTRAARDSLKTVLETRYTGDSGRRWARYASRMEFPETFPAFGDLRVDEDGRVWIQRYEVPWTTGPQQWVVYTREREVPVANVTVPERALPNCLRTIYGCSTGSGILEIGPDYWLVVKHDDLGVPRVEKHRIVR